MGQAFVSGCPIGRFQLPASVRVVLLFNRQAFP
nr:MAG TPA_asm: hypothetical protein [Caudoviricetes sp.]